MRWSTLIIGGNSYTYQLNYYYIPVPKTDSELLWRRFLAKTENKNILKLDNIQVTKPFPFKRSLFLVNQLSPLFNVYMVTSLLHNYKLLDNPIASSFQQAVVTYLQNVGIPEEYWNAAK